MGLRFELRVVTVDGGLRVGLLFNLVEESWAIVTSLSSGSPLKL